MTTYEYPGVYIEEDASLALSVRTSATAIPVFAVKDENLFKSGDGYYRVNSWLEYLTLRNRQFNPNDKLDISLRAYFINGGGYCYLVKTEELVNQVPKLDDVTLLVAAGEDINTAVGTLCKPGKGLFAIFDGPQADITEVTKVTKEDGATDIEKPDPDKILKPYNATPYGAVTIPG